MTTSCHHLWETEREPELKIFCSKCGKIFDVNDPDCVVSLHDTWKETLNHSGLLRRK